MEFFAHYPKIQYDFGEKILEMPDLLTRVSLSNLININQDVFYKYIWSEFDTIDSIAELYYDSKALWWLVLMSSEIVDPISELPLDDEQLTKHIVRKWRQSALDNGYEDSEIGIITYTKDTVFEYRDSDGDAIDQDTYTNLSPQERTLITLFDREQELNEKNRDVELLTVDLADIALDQLQDFLKSHISRAQSR